MSDITVNVGGYRVNLRVGAIVCQGDKVLVCRMRDKNWWFLPGGRIKTNESSLVALKRELSEEIGESFHIVRPAICSENFFELDGHSFHEVCTYYEVQWLGTENLEQQENANEVFDWIARKDVSNIDLKPAFIKRHLVNPSPNLELVIHRDGEQGAGADGVNAAAPD